MATGEELTAIGLRRVHVAVRDDDGTIQIAGSPAAGVAYNGIRALKSRALTVTLAEPQRVTAQGDDTAYHTFQEAPSDTPSGELRTQVSDTELITLITSVTDFGSGNNRMIPLGTDKVGQEDPMIVWGSQKAIDTEAGGGKTRHWRTMIFLNAIMSARPPSMELAQIGEFVWSMAGNSSSTDQFGRTVAAGVHGCTEMAMVEVHTRYKFMMDAFEGDGAQLTFTMSQGSNVINATATSPFFVFVDGVEDTAPTMSAAGVLTFAIAPVNGAKIIVQYEYDD
jgi:hypothetical protein